MPIENLIQAVEQDLEQLISCSVPENTIIEQVQAFRKGIEPVRITAPATLGNGITAISDKAKFSLLTSFNNAQAQGRVSKFVPASGAATRMFKSLLSVYNALANGENISRVNSDYKEVKQFLSCLDQFAFYDDLKEYLTETGQNLDKLREDNNIYEILEAVLMENGLNYARLPKGLIKFHRCNGKSTTPFGEHLVEADEYCRDSSGKIRTHFTVPKAHKNKIEKHCIAETNSIKNDAKQYDISFSIQKPSTNIIAVDLNNDGFRTSSGKLLFRPAGHGALLENLNDVNGDIIFLKNIDNVVPERINGKSNKYKKLLGGLLVKLQKEIFGFLTRLEVEDLSGQLLSEVEEFVCEKLFLKLPNNFEYFSNKEKKDFFFSQLNRPLRVCGMVENQGKTGGGPFWVQHSDGRQSLQIIESPQIDQSNPDQQKILQSSTHFNPVDIVCGVRDYMGRPFNLVDYIDKETCFITIKSKDGQELKAMELPGLWNGAMANWTTIFVEVPVYTFNPVKTVNDLLRPEHQS